MTIVLKKDDGKGSDFTEEWNLLTDKIQFFNDVVLNNFIQKYLR